MTTNTLFFTFKDEGRVIATFGQASLVKTLDGKFELRGGSKSDRTSAYEWISLFMHHVVVRELPRG